MALNKPSQVFLQKLPTSNVENHESLPTSALHLRVVLERSLQDPPRHSAWRKRYRSKGASRGESSMILASGAQGSVGTKLARFFIGRTEEQWNLEFFRCKVPKIPTSQASTAVLWAAFAASAASTFGAATNAERPAMHCLDSLNRYGIADCKSPRIQRVEWEKNKPKIVTSGSRNHARKLGIWLKHPIEAVRFFMAQGILSMSFQKRCFIKCLENALKDVGSSLFMTHLLWSAEDVWICWNLVDGLCCMVCFLTYAMHCTEKSHDHS